LKPIGEHVLLSDESSSIAIVEIAGVVHVMVGTWSSSLQVYRLEEGMGLMPVTEVPCMCSNLLYNFQLTLRH